MNREDMIDRLVDDDIDTILSSGTCADYISHILRRGKGYELQTDQEIAHEFKSRTWEKE
jgi:hypothetical protein